jgi:hypothetical protein
MTASGRRTALGALALMVLAGCSTAVSGTAAGPTAAPSAADSTGPTAAPSAADSTGPGNSSAAPSDSATSTGSAAAVTSTEPRPRTTTTMTYGTFPPTDLSGADYGIVTAVDLPNSQLTLDRVSWFTGADAQQACADDGVTATDNNWCTGYYYRNNNPALRVVAVSPEARISTLVGSRSTPSDLATVATRIAIVPSVYRLTVVDGQITELEELYQP